MLAVAVNDIGWKYHATGGKGTAARIHAWPNKPGILSDYAARKFRGYVAPGKLTKTAPELAEEAAQEAFAIAADAATPVIDRFKEGARKIP